MLLQLSSDIILPPHAKRTGGSPEAWAGGGCVHGRDVWLVRCSPFAMMQRPHGPTTIAAAKGMADDKVLSSTGAAEAMQEGFSLVVRSATCRWARLREIAAAFESRLGLFCNGNLYCSPAATQAFECHYDDHDVFVLQLGGSKRWRLFANVCALPCLGDERSTPSVESAGLPSEVVLHEGDVLYVPRGVAHECLAGAVEDSIHLSLAVEVEPYQRVEALLHAAIASSSIRAAAHGVTAIEDAEVYVGLHVAVRVFAAITVELRQALCQGRMGAGAMEVQDAWARFGPRLAASLPSLPMPNAAQASRYASELAWLELLDGGRFEAAVALSAGVCPAAPKPVRRDVELRAAIAGLRPDFAAGAAALAAVGGAYRDVRACVTALALDLHAANWQSELSP